MTTTQEEIVSIEELLECGAHFGHRKYRWNPKMKRFIFKEKDGIYIIDLAKTVQQIRKAIEIIQETVSRRKSILFVGTKKQAKTIIRECAEACDEFYICERWLGGTLTNLATIRQSVKTLERLEKRIASKGSGFTKNEMTLMSKDRTKLDRNLSGIRAMKKLPGLLIVVDPNREHIAVAEANKLGIPIMALVDTDSDPDLIDHVIPCNDDALKSIRLILYALQEALITKKNEIRSITSKDDLREEEHLEESPLEKIEEKWEEGLNSSEREDS